MNTPREKIIFEHSRPGRAASAQLPDAVQGDARPMTIPAHLLRADPPALPEVS